MPDDAELTPEDEKLLAASQEAVRGVLRDRRRSETDDPQAPEQSAIAAEAVAEAAVRRTVDSEVIWQAFWSQLRTRVINRLKTMLGIVLAVLTVATMITSLVSGILDIVTFFNGPGTSQDLP